MLRIAVMRTEFLALALFTASALYGQSWCPVQAPFGAWITVNVCPPGTGCVAGSTLTLMTQELLPPAPPPGPQPPCGGVPCAPVYSIQACDKVTWHFGDGTPDVTVMGLPMVTHTYNAPGTYSPYVTISNALGSIDGEKFYPLVISSGPPTYVDFSPAQITVPESAGSITFTLVRSGNLTTTAKVHYAHDSYGYKSLEQAETISGDLTFAPGETTKSFTMKIFDDHVYTAPFTDAVSASATDGTIVRANTASFTLTEVTPQPTATVSDVRVAEGTATPNIADVVVTMSAPIAGTTVEFLGRPSDGTATFPSDYGHDTICDIPEGQTQCVMHFGIVNDDVPEPDETFTVKTTTIVSTAGPRFLKDTATVTIVNDDAAITPPAMQVATGTPVSLKLDIGQPPSSPLTIPLQSSSPEVLGVPASITIAAGEHSASFTAHALQAGRSRIAAQIPGLTAPPAIVTVVDAVTIVAQPGALALRPGSDGAIAVSLQPPRGVMQAVNVWSTRPDIATVPESLTIPAGGTATLNVHAVADGVASIGIGTSDGASFNVDVVVADSVTVARIEPASAPAAGGTSVTLIGEGLDARCSVAFGATPAASVSAAANGLAVVVPAHKPGVVDVDVVCGSARFTLRNAFTFFVPRRRAAG
jgi:PKD repeat protein